MTIIHIENSEMATERLGGSRTEIESIPIGKTGDISDPDAIHDTVGKGSNPSLRDPDESIIPTPKAGIIENETTEVTFEAFEEEFATFIDCRFTSHANDTSHSEHDHEKIPFEGTISTGMAKKIAD